MSAPVLRLNKTQRVALGKKISLLRTSQGYKQVRLAKKMGVSQSTLCLLEKGIYQSNLLKHVKRLSRSLNTSMDTLVHNGE